MPPGNPLFPLAPLSLDSLLVNLLIGAVISVVLAWHFRRFGATMSNRTALAQIFPLVVLTTVLVISVVKSSLALSLGLVGALSIVRFRTPIKEPEELAYLFMAIGVGLGLGADHRLPTIVASAVILGVVSARRWVMRPARGHNLFLNIDVPDGGRNGVLEEVTDLVRHSVRTADVRRFDVQNGQLQATFLIDCRDDRELLAVAAKLRETFPAADVTFVDQGGMGGVNP